MAVKPETNYYFYLASKSTKYVQNTLQCTDICHHLL